MGIVLGLGAGIFFSLSTIFARVGHRSRFDDDGLFMSILVNVVILGLAAMAVEAPQWDTAGVIGIAVGGIIGTVAGRSSNLRAVRLIGPSRANAFLTASPVPTAIFGVFLLNETVGLIDAAGAVLVIGGLLLMARARSSAVSLISPDAPPSRRQTPLAGYLFAVAAPTFFGLAFVAKKWGLILFPSAVVGAFIGAAAAFLVVLVSDLLRSNLGNRLRLNFARVPWWFVGTGLATSAALLCQFTAFTYVDAWVVGVLQGTQAMWTLLFGYAFMRSEERIDRRLVATVVLVVAGVTVIGLQV